jgi:hypothetical protein
MNSSAGNTRLNVGLLAACQALLLTNNTTLISINGLAGLALAPDPSLATLPVTGWVLGGALATVPASQYMKKVGRRTGLIHGALIGIVGALLCGSAILQESFWLLCFGTVVFGVYNAFGQYYRFVAAESAPPDFRATAISLVLAGGLVGGILGPMTSTYTVDLLGPRYTGAYLALIAFSLVAICVISLIRVPELSAAQQAARGRPLREIAQQPKFVVAMMSSAIGYGVMNFLMTSDAAGNAGLRARLRRHGDRDFLARGGDVRALVRDRLADRAAGRGPGHAHRRRAERGGHRGRAGGRGGGQFLVVAGAAGRGLEFPLHRWHHAAHRDLQARGARQGAGSQRIRGFRDDDAVLARLRHDRRERRLGQGEHRSLAAGAAGDGGPRLPVHRDAEKQGMSVRAAAAIGMRLEEVDTPALILDLDAFEANLKRLNDAVKGRVRVRAHAKTHKCPEIAKRQIAAGAVGVCCQKVSEAEAMVEGGVADVLISNEIIGATKLARLAELAKRARIGVCVDHADNVRELQLAASKAGAKVDAYIELEVGMRRAGVAAGRTGARAGEADRRFAGPALCRHPRLSRPRAAHPLGRRAPRGDREFRPDREEHQGAAAAERHRMPDRHRRGQRQLHVRGGIRRLG